MFGAFRIGGMTEPIAGANMLIHRPPADVFDAFANPLKITQFWLTRASGPLARGARVEWEFMVPGVTAGVAVTTFDPPRRLGWDWSDGHHVEMTFDPHDRDSTRVAVHETGFAGDRAAEEVATTTEGYSIVLCDLKTLLETGRSANLVKDKAALIEASLSN
jgi:uncharacterized protein YndB with AHSA1/START domain